MSRLTLMLGVNNSSQERVLVLVGWMSVGVVDVLRTRVNGNVPERGPVYNRSGAGSGSVMDTDAKAVEELLTCSGRAGCVRGFCF
jgi:hypothetical protein